MNDRDYSTYRVMELIVDRSDAIELLCRLLALKFGRYDRVVLGGDGGKKVTVNSSGQSLDKKRIEPQGEAWTVSLPEDEIDYWCRFLAEIVLGIAAVDHVDSDDPNDPHHGVTLRSVEPFISVDEAEARRRLNM